MYNFEPERVRQFLEGQGATRAAIQLPAGLREHLRGIMPAFEEAGVEAMVLADSCYGACDLADIRAKQIGCDVLVHYGHADMGLPTTLPILYVEARMKVDPTEAIKRALPKLKDKRWGLATTVQHIEYLPRVRELLEKNSIEATIGDPGPRAKYPGQVLGCDWGCARSVAGKVDGILYLGTGRFHPLGIALATGKEVVTVNPLTGGHEKVSGDLSGFLRGRKAMVKRAASCESFCVVTSFKPGQRRFKLARRLVEELRGDGLSATLLLADEITPEKLEDFRAEVFVCVACPRIPVDDAERFDCPILTPFEARAARGKVDLEPYKLDEIQPKDS
jgi:2-(3-amino-3-carboxypropyl)histidine synthase